MLEPHQDGLPGGQISDSPSSLRAHREVCYRCHKASVVCVCADVPRVANRTDLVILQHGRERFHPIGTVRFAELGLERVRVHVRPPSQLEVSRDELVGPGATGRVGLLYPSPKARVLSAVAPDERPERLIVLDGTWTEAKNLARANPWLTELPTFVLAPKEKGRYRIRLEPNDQALSTIEAIVEALEVLEPETPGLSGLIGAFTRMIDKQVEYTRVPHPRQKKRPLGPAPIALPPLLREASPRLVLGHGEFVAIEPDRYEVVSWTGVRMDTGETFEGFARPTGVDAGVPSDRHLGHMGLDRARIEAAEPAEVLRARWRAFLGEDETLAVWSQSVLDFLGEGWATRPPLALKTVYTNARRRKAGPLEDVIQAEGLAAEALPFAGRGRRIMGDLLPVARLLVALGR